MEEKQSRGRDRLRQLMKTGPYFDYNIIFLVIALAVIGIIMIFSITSTESAEVQNSFFGNQAMFAVAGVVMMLLVSFVPFQVYKKLTPFVVGAAVVALALVLTPLRVSSHGASRWINLGFTTLQPAEIAKIAIIFFSALLISRWGKNITRKKPMFELAFVTAVLCGEILVFTSNLSSAIIVLGIAFLMFFLSTPKTRWFVILMVACLLFVGIFVVFIRSTTSVEEIREKSLSQEEGSYRADRIYAWLYTEELNDDLSFQVVNGLYAIGSGGLFGKGLGASDQKYILPEAQNDMIFTIICEELGLSRTAFVYAAAAPYLHHRPNVAGCVWLHAGHGGISAHWHPGGAQCGGGIQLYSQYGHFPAVHQLRRIVHDPAYGRDRRGAQRGKTDPRG